MDEEDIISAMGLDPSEFGIVQTDKAILLNTGPVPDYDAPATGVYTNTVPMEKFRKSGAIYQQARTSTGGESTRGGRVGRLVNNKLKQDLQRELVKCFVENYETLGIKVDTGQLLASVKQGTFTDEGGEALYRFSYKIADLPGQDKAIGPVPRSRDSMSFQERPSTAYYGPRVFYGRAAIITPNSKMRFLNKQGHLVKTNKVAAASPKNIFLLNSAQIDRLNNIIRKPMGDSVKKQVKAILEGQGQSADAD